MSKLNDVFCSDNSVVERGIQKIVNQAYDGQWCSSCKHSYFLSGDTDLAIKCQISDNLCRKRGTGETQLCLFYEAKNS